MPVTFRQLQDYQPSPEDLEEIAESINRLDEAVKTMMSYVAQQIEEVAQVALSGLTRQFEESISAVASQVAQQLSAVDTGYSTGILQDTIEENLKRYSGPAFIPPHLYVRQPPPQLPPNVRRINGRYFYIDDYKPGLN